MPRKLCPLNAIAVDGSKGIYLDDASEAALFLVRRGERVFAYRNRCPHTGAPLEWQEGRFLDSDGALIQCATHDALFRIEDGVCIAGPCVGAALQPLPVRVVDGVVLLDASPGDSASR
jgi:nitrite reductase/ring-hydroxylating ferredoxin subunit